MLIVTYCFARCSCHDLNSWGLWDSLYHVVRQDSEQPDVVPEEIICKAISCCTQALPWFLHALDNTSPDKVGPSSCCFLTHTFR